MLVEKIDIKSAKGNIQVKDCYISRGLKEGGHSSAPDIDSDLASDRRHEIKEYLEQRYNVDGKQRVFSAGTFSSMKLKAVLKDVARVYRVPVSLMNYITAIFEDDNMGWTELFKLAATNKKVRKFILDYPEVIEDIRGLLGQPRSASIHASAIIVTPDEKDGEPAECFDFLPIRKMDGLLVSEFDGYEIENIGLLKEDLLATKELSKLSAVLSIVNRTYGANYSIEYITEKALDDVKTYNLLSSGFTQNVFQFASRGITRFIMDVMPDNIEDLIAINALFRPATLEIGATEDYIRYKRGEVAPVYNYGTFEATKNTYGIMTYQEQFMSIAHTLGGFDLGKTDYLRKAIGKKDAQLMATLKDDFINGAIQNGCPDYEANEIWHKIEVAGKYSFNRCISGKEKIYRPCGGRWQPTIKEMYRLLNDPDYARETNHKSLRTKYLKNGYGVAFSLNEDERLVKNRIVDIQFAGIKPLYRITLEDGKTIDVTSNHKHPTQRGEVRTDELMIGEDMLFVNNGFDKKDTSYRFTDKGKENDRWYHNNFDLKKYELNSQKGHMGFMQRPESEYVRREYYRNNLMKSYCEECGKEHCRLEIHHINGNHAECGDNFCNLVTLCVSCHKKNHYEMGRLKWGQKGLSTKLGTVKSIEYIGDEEVYDVEMRAPYHSYATQGGIVTCNSHAAAYALTAYCGAWLKANYPTAFYTVALQWCDDKEITSLMSEMEECSNAKIVPPDINVSGSEFFTDYSTDKIFWSLSRIKMLGAKTVDYIIEERDKNGQFLSIENFIHRIFKYKLRMKHYWDDPEDENEVRKISVNTLHVRHLILAGCFDNLEKIKSINERYHILETASTELGLSKNANESYRQFYDLDHFWSIQQINLSGIGAIDYRRIFDKSSVKDHIKGKASYMPLKDAMDIDNEGKRIVVCATVLEVEELGYNDKMSGDRKSFAKIKLQQNNDIMEYVFWSDYYEEHKKQIQELKGKIVILTGAIKYSDYAGCNNINTFKHTLLSIV